MYSDVCDDMVAALSVGGCTGWEVMVCERPEGAAPKILEKAASR